VLDLPRFYSGCHITELYAVFQIMFYRNCCILLYGAYMVDSKKQLNVRISDELFNKIESEDRSKQDIISDALLLYFDSKNKLNVANELEHEKEKARMLENNIKDLQQQIGFLTQDHIRISGQLDRLLMPSPQEIMKKNWWKFWK